MAQALDSLAYTEKYLITSKGTSIFSVTSFKSQKGRIAVRTHEVRQEGKGHGCPESIITVIYE